MKISVMILSFIISLILIDITVNMCVKINYNDIVNNNKDTFEFK